MGRIIAFGGRLSAIFWYPKSSAEGWYRLTPLLYRPVFLVHVLIHALYLSLHIVVQNKFSIYLSAISHVLFSYWTPTYIDDLADFSKCTLVGFIMVACQLSSTYVAPLRSVEFPIMVTIIIALIFVYVPCIHAAFRQQKKVYSVEYEERSQREIV